MSDVLFRINLFSKEIAEELSCCFKYEESHKDILIVVHNQLDYLKKCISSIQSCTKNFKIFIWDNGSDIETKEWLSQQKDFFIISNPENIGFIIPNNELAKHGNSEYIILLNSDTEVLPNWDSAMISQIQQNKYAQVGYLGGKVDSEGKGKIFKFGSDLDYVCGWCFCIPRSIYQKYGLFDQENLTFAYCEDSDFSLRLTDSGEKIYALHLGLVIHHENKTIKTVMKEMDCKLSFERNHKFIKKRWKHKFSDG